MMNQFSMRMLLAFVIFLTLPFFATGCLSGIRKHDKLIVLAGECDRALADLDAQYQRRADLLPNMVKIAKKRAESEQDILTGIVEQRAKATAITLSPDVMKDPEALAVYQSNQQQIAQSFGRLMEIHEMYPELKSDAGFQELMTQLEGTENRILVARKKYNQAVMDYNNELMIVTGKALDAITGDDMFQPRPFYQAQTGVEKSPELDM
jgi:LemA protein